MVCWLMERKSYTRWNNQTKTDSAFSDFVPSDELGRLLRTTLDFPRNWEVFRTGAGRAVVGELALETLLKK